MILLFLFAFIILEYAFEWDIMLFGKLWACLPSYLCMLVFIGQGVVPKTIQPGTHVEITARIMEMHNRKWSSIITVRIMEIENRKRSSIITDRIMEIDNNKPSYCYWGLGFDSHTLCRGWIFVVVVVCIDKYLIMHRMIFFDKDILL